MGAKNYTLDERILLNERLQHYLQPYYENEGKKLRKLVDEILIRLKYYDVAKDEFVSLADEIIVNAMYDYDFKQDFNGYIYRCLENKFKSEMTKLNRQKRKADKMALSWEMPMNEESDVTIGNIITDTKEAYHYDIDKTFFEDDGEKYTEKMLKYIDRLSNLQKEVVKLIISGYMVEEIKKILHINEKQYQDCMIGIRSYRNIKALL